MSGNGWLILLCGGMFLAVPLGMVLADWRNQRHRRRAADDLTALWDGPDYMTWHREYLYGASDVWYMPCAVCGTHLGVGVEAWVKDDEHGNGEAARCLSHGQPEAPAYDEQEGS